MSFLNEVKKVSCSKNYTQRIIEEIKSEILVSCHCQKQFQGIINGSPLDKGEIIDYFIKEGFSVDSLDSGEGLCHITISGW